MKYLYQARAWLLVRPIRWSFSNMISASCRLRILPEKHQFFGWQAPNIHWWLLYKTVFKFCKWLHYDAWRPFCDWTGGYRRSFPFIARLIKSIGSTTAGYAIGGGQCFHCASIHGDPIELAGDESGTDFELLDAWSVGTQDGTDHRFRGITTCPKCGYQAEYEDGSL